jgi:hypothetical protein
LKEKIFNLESDISLLKIHISQKNKILEENEIALNDFENVLEVFQSESQNKLAQLNREMKLKNEKIDQLHESMSQLEHVSIELKEKNEKLNSIENENKKMKSSFLEISSKSNYFYQMLQESITRVNDVNLVDRRIIIGLLLRYLENKETQVLKLLSSTLRCTKNEQERLEWITGVSSGYISGWFSSGPPSSSSSSVGNESQRSLSSLWVEFLMNESIN